MAQNLTVTLYGIKDLRVENQPIPEPKENEVLLKMGCVGICGSDVHYYTEGHCGDYVVKEPMIIGHEASGTVCKIGSKVTHLKPGDRVAIEPGVPCGSCNFCRTGRYNLCSDILFCATPPVHGNLRQYYCHSADFCFKLPDNLSLEEGALLEPTAVGLHSCRKGGVTLGSTVLITGGGPIGIVTSVVAKAMGARKVMVTGSHDYGLEMAKKLGADEVLKVNKNEDLKELSKKVIETLGERPQITIDCAGKQSSLGLGLETTEWGGVLVVVGCADHTVTTDLVPALSRELDIRGIFRYANDYPGSIHLVASGKADVKQMITHNFDITQSVEAFDAAAEQKGNPIKIMIHCNEDCINNSNKTYEKHNH
ncbi:sorbitol dehydrogenase-like [Lycorma delicatula]|uniref:sorbitol dehydrogenase-like n=1 Tax=Lycorma delicatula TaxID=130591 RepID=UPI003F516090